MKGILEDVRHESEARGPRPTRALDKMVLLARLLVRVGRVFVSLPTVPLRSLGMLLGRFMLAHLVVVSRLEVVMSGGRVVGGGPVVVLGWCALSGRHRCRGLGGRGHVSILLWGY
jgi:hypothetical protein